MLNTTYLSLGSNIDPARNVKAAVRMLSQLTRLVAVSSVWETAPVGMVNQPPFLNAAIIVQTELTPRQLKKNILEPIEQLLGRVRRDHLGSLTVRTVVDVDPLNLL